MGHSEETLDKSKTVGPCPVPGTFNFKGGLDGSVLHLPVACSIHPVLFPHPVLSLGRCFMAPASSLTGDPLRIHFHYRQWLFRAFTLCSDSSHVTSCLASLRGSLKPFRKNPGALTLTPFMTPKLPPHRKLLRFGCFAGMGPGLLGSQLQQLL